MATNQTGNTRSEESISSLVLSDDTRTSIERYTSLKVDMEMRGGVHKSDLEHARSYAVEALQGIFRDNPELFDFARRMEAVRTTKLEAATRG